MKDDDKHKSEKGIDIKYVQDVIINFGTLTQLETQAKAIARRYNI